MEQIERHSLPRLRPAVYRIRDLSEGEAGGCSGDGRPGKLWGARRTSRALRLCGLHGAQGNDQRNHSRRLILPPDWQLGPRFSGGLAVLGYRWESGGAAKPLEEVWESQGLITSTKHG